MYNSSKCIGGDALFWRI